MDGNDRLLNEAHLELLERLTGKRFAEADLAEIAVPLSATLDMIAILDELDLTDVPPAFQFDPHWPGEAE